MFQKIRINFKELFQNKQKLIALFISLLLSLVATLLAIYGVRKYGIALFALTPFLLGFSASLVNGWNRKTTLSESLFVGLFSISLYAICLLIFAIEGVICILMAAPLGLLACFLGSLFAHFLLQKAQKNSHLMFLIILLSVPLVSFTEDTQSQKLIKVSTSMVIDAPPEKVWQNIIEFPELEKPKELIFRAGFAYPIHAQISGRGKGAIRKCNFSTGSFIEPITNWDEPRLLQFDVAENPPPMKELSLWDLDAPHLHDYFISKKGQFQLTPIGENKTLLIGSTWYFHRIQPSAYWQIWSNYIIHKIHVRVLTHIKKQSEKTT